MTSRYRLWLAVVRLHYATFRQTIHTAERQRVEAAYRNLETIPLPLFLYEVVRAATMRIWVPIVFLRTAGTRPDVSHS